MRHDIYKGEDLLRWTPIHGGRSRLDGSGELVYSDTDGLDWHLLRLTGFEFLAARISLKVRFHSLPGQDANFYIHHYGALDVVEVSPVGEIINRGISEAAEINRDTNGCLSLEVTFINLHGTLAIGSSKQGGRYRGSGAEQFVIESIEVGIEYDDAVLIGPDSEERIRIIDVGGAGGLQGNWLMNPKMITPVLFEPNPEEAAKLRSVFERFPGGKVVECGLAQKKSRMALNIARYFGCTSVLKPNFEILSKYTIGPIFETIRSVEVDLVRYDELYAAGKVPVPDVIKIDVQGFEYQVLLGFGGLLESCLAIELEAHFYPLYEGQKLLHDVVDLLHQFGMTLHSVNKVSNFDGDLVEVDAFFLREKRLLTSMGDLAQKKMEFIKRTWSI